MKKRLLNLISLVLAGKEFDGKLTEYLTEHEYALDDLIGIKRYYKCVKLFKVFPFLSSDYFQELLFNN